MNLSSANAFNFDPSKILSSDKQLNNDLFTAKVENNSIFTFSKNVF